MARSTSTPENGPLHWSVIMVRPPPGSRGARTRPMVAWSGKDRDLSERTAAGLRALGAEVVLVEGDDSVHCANHPAQLNVAVCDACGRRICHTCHVSAGAARCIACAASRRRRVGTQRVRQLFALFVFAAFLSQVYAWKSREDALVDATGTVRVAFIQLVRPEVAGHRLVSAMSHGGIHAIAPWFEAERARYAAGEAPVLDIHVLGPWVSRVSPPMLPESGGSWLDQLRISLAFPRYFHSLAREHGVDPEAYGARVYIVYGNDDGDLASESRGSRTGRVAVSFVPVNTSSLAYAQVTVAHELAHILGAEDLYDPETFLAQFPDGLVQPWAQPPYPQRYAELMAVDRPLSPSTESEVRALDDVRIGYRTAARLGWITSDQADGYLTPALTAPDEGLAVHVTEPPTDRPQN